MNVAEKIGLTEDDLQPLIRMAFEAGNPNQFLKNIPYCQFMGIEAFDAGEELPLFRMPFKPELIGNPVLPAFHGGALGGFLEMAAIGGLIWAEEVARLPRIINLTVSYLNSAGPKDCTARVTITRQGRNMAAVRVMGWQDKPEKPFAQMIGHFIYD